VQRGWSVIPLRGDASPASPKAPSLPRWKEYQQRRPTYREIAYWFKEQEQRALGIVLGQVSGLVVVDIDVPAGDKEFAERFPDLLDTFTVRSGNRGLPHYYFQIPRSLIVAGHSHGGIELRGEGQYVVAPGTSIAGKRWEVINDVAPRILTEADLSRLAGFLCSTPAEPSVNRSQGRSRAISEVVNAPSRLVADVAPITGGGLRRRYEHLAPRRGRNNALFHLACYARDCGWPQVKTEGVLRSVHTFQPGPASHPAETATRREREAARTIASAYSQPPRILTPRTSDSQQLPNAIREKLLQLDLDRIAQILDGLLLAGFEAGSRFTAAQAYAALSRFGIGRNAVFAALKTILHDGQSVFVPVSPSSPLDPPSSHANAAKRSAEETKQCLFGRVANPVKKPGRPPISYVMPSIEELSRLLRLDVVAGSGDTLTPEDLRSPAAYRAALHNALIRRAPGRYSRDWLSRRLGISADSCRRYERRGGIQVIPTFQRWTLSWGDLEKKLPDEAVPGCFIEDENGRRYPPLIVIARKLLARKRRIWYVIQDVNEYHAPPEHGSVKPEMMPLDAALPANMQPQSIERRLFPRPEYAAIAATAPDDAHSTQGCISTVERALGAASGDPTREVLRLRSPGGAIIEEPERAKNPTKAAPPAKNDHDDFAEVLYDTLRRMNPERSITRKCAGNLVRTYGRSLVGRGLRVLASRQNIHNPAGFLRTWLRCEKPSVGKKSAPAHKRRKASSEHSDNLTADWVERLRQSPYAQYLSNAEDVLGPETPR
jgi:hypothetical protein